ncbi:MULTISPECIES: hypothetical protein [unclassified Streptomyces]|uniref:hypothetical protein n=1 Tax=unclassified Streptomyces TaxID=2593676 RepID=UPI0001C1949F|nr:MULTISPECIES: hypothetical protein [unclassified Streptomyces]MYR65212.1 hypothetical protein [Streptomyces sp. SID4939]MYS04777.1 hypothetical protein [Streptomyces sp. SID4940]MYT67207.1 hypothetical protein [Streptomyces sp. SID8357]MYT88107.1 hypothetical protein [Streptomyces sp. SID8360]MYW40793.1 hypothetical protein [Streptomyces sp. SID1]
MFTGGTARLLVRNDGEAALELTVEPWADAYQLLPGQTCVVVTHSPTEDGSWSGTLRRDEPFQVDHRRDSVTVWANGNCFHLSDMAGGAIDAADWQCPAQSGVPEK